MAKWVPGHPHLNIQAKEVSDVKKSLDYDKLGLMVGLELHQQLDTARKLYCHCPTIIRDEEPDGHFIRRLRPTQSELGEVDPAALFEFQKKKMFYYEYYNDTTCLVEMDEEPPHNLDDESIDICIIMATYLGSSVVDEIHPMRKIVIDGSNTTGFQRTAVVAMGGSVMVGDKKVGIQTICLEEDAARKIADDEKNNFRIYRLDRLGIPLIEIATAPDIRTPDEAQEAALTLGLLLRSTGRVKRGLGTIRQDVNVSIRDGGIIEIKGLQQLDMLSTVVELEALRQFNLLQIRELLVERDITPEEIADETFDVTKVFESSESKVIRRALKKGGRVFAARLPGFAGLLGQEIQPERRLGTELADYARFWGGVGGLFHTDELPKYGITENDVNELRRSLSANEKDAIVIVADEKSKCEDALRAVIKRAKAAVVGVPPETRVPLPNGTTKYARPRPGAERMYPETDVRAVKITQARLKRIRRNMPETLEEKEDRFIKELGLSRELAHQITRSTYLPLFESLVRETNTSPTLIAVTLENTLVSLHRDGVNIERITEDHLHDMFTAVSKGAISTQGIPDILTYLAEHPLASVDQAIDVTGLGAISTDMLEGKIHEVVNANIDFINEHGIRAVGRLMGVLMKELRGKADGKTVKEILTREVQRVLEN